MTRTQNYVKYALMSLFAATLAAINFSAGAADLGNEKDSAAKGAISPAETAVRKVVDQHIQGIVKADAKLLNEAWDTRTGRISFISQNEDGEEVTQSGPIADSIKLWTAAERSGTKGVIQSVDVVNDKMALAKARITWNSQVFDDYLVLLKTEGQWRLVSKTYTSKRASGFLYGAVSLP